MSFRGSLLVLALFTPGVLLLAQNAPAPQQPASAAPASSTFNTLQPMVQIVKQAIASVNLDKWKASNAIRDEADSNLRSVERDMDSTLPGLVSAADGAPDSTAKTIPVFRNVDALYDVMLRIDAAARLAAPKDQLSALDQALTSVSDARRAVGDRLQSTAEAQETRVAHLQAQLKAVPPPTPPPAPVTCPPPPTTTKKRRSTTTKPKTTTESTPQNSTQTH